jgi:hypothetical protein
MNGVSLHGGNDEGGWPPLRLELTQPTPGAWDAILRRARRRRRRAVSLATAAVVLAAGVPATLALSPERDAPPVAHRSAEQHSDICDVPYDQSAPAGDRIERPFRTGGLLVSPPPAGAQPAVTQSVLLQRAKARGTHVEPGTQLRYGVTRRIQIDGRIGQPTLRWVLTTCGQPGREMLWPATPPTAPPQSRFPTVPVAQDEIALLTDSGATTEGGFRRGFEGVCATRLQNNGPDERSVNGDFVIGELRVTQPPAEATLGGRERVIEAVRQRGVMFPGTQVRLALTSPLHAPGTPRLHWVVTTCGLDGASVRPTLPGVISEALVYDSRGRLLETHRAGQLSAALAALRRVTTPATIPTYAAAHPNMCGPWTHAYSDFKDKASAAGYTNLQGCYRQADSTVIYISSAAHGAAAAVFTASGKTYQDVHSAGFPYSAFTLIPAPEGATHAKLLRLLSPTVAEVQLTGPDMESTSYKFDARARAWQECDDTRGTRATCTG